MNHWEKSNHSERTECFPSAHPN